MMERTAAYIRVSSQEQVLHGLSLNAQRDTLSAYAKNHDLDIVAWYEDEGVSGRKEVRRRPALQRMMQDAEKEIFKRIIFIKLDRYFRSVGEYYACQKILDAHGILWSATQEDYDLTTATGRLLVSQKLAIAEYEADNTGERIRLVNEYKVKQGAPLTGSHRLGIGWKVEQTPNGKRVVHDPETEQLVKDYVENFLQHNSLRRACFFVNDKYGTQYTHESLKKMISDEKMIGRYRGNDSYCPPYMDEDTWNHVQELLKRNIKVLPSRRTYLFSGLLLCPLCGKRMAALYNKGYVYYRCPKAYHYNACTYRRSVSQNLLESGLKEILASKMREYVASARLEGLNAEYIDPEPIQAEIRRLNTIFQKGRMDEATYDREYMDLERRLADVKASNERRGSRDFSKYEELLKSDWQTEYGMLDDEHKRSFWHELIKEIHIDSQTKEASAILFF